MELPEIIKADPGKLLCKKFTWGLHDHFDFYLSLGDDAMVRQSQPGRRVQSRRSRVS